MVNGKAHYYDQREVQDDAQAEENECGTAGCVAGYVLAHAKTVQRVRRLRGESSPFGYIQAATNDELTPDGVYKPVAPLLDALYSEGGHHKLAVARRVVTKMLRTGKVSWR